MIAIKTGPAFGELRTISAQLEQHQCQAELCCTHRGDDVRPGQRCGSMARYGGFCWVHMSAANNPNRARKLHLHKSVTE